MSRWTGVKAKLGLPVHPYMLRHSCRFKLANDSHDTRSIQHYLDIGHRNIQNTVPYMQVLHSRFKGFWKGWRLFYKKSQLIPTAKFFIIAISKYIHSAYYLLKGGKSSAQEIIYPINFLTPLKTHIATKIIPNIHIVIFTASKYIIVLILNPSFLMIN